MGPVQYYHLTRTGALMRAEGGTHDMFSTRQGEWIRTDRILKAHIGQENDLEAITEAEARELEPAAFAD